MLEAWFPRSWFAWNWVVFWGLLVLRQGKFWANWDQLVTLNGFLPGLDVIFFQFVSLMISSDWSRGECSKAKIRMLLSEKEASRLGHWGLLALGKRKFGVILLVTTLKFEVKDKTSKGFICLNLFFRHLSSSGTYGVGLRGVGNCGCCK